MRKALLSCLVTVALAGTILPSHAAVLGGPVINPANGHSYYLLTENNWTGSEAEAISIQGNLVSINDPAENEWVYGTFAHFGGVGRALWIGLSDANVEGTFVWANSELVSYTNFGPGEPNNLFNEDFVFMLAAPYQLIDARQWNDAPDVLAGIHGVVEIPAVPEPSILPLTLIGLAVISMYVRKRRITNGSIASTVRRMFH